MPPVQISCVIPVRDGERFLGEAIESALAQSLPPLEVIVVIDGGTDRSGAIAESFGSPVRVLHTAGRGPAVARNLGIADAAGDIIALLDCDDIWLSGKLEAQATALAGAADQAISVCGVENFWMAEVEAERCHTLDTRFSGVLPGYCCSALAVPRALFQQIGGFDPARRHTDLIHWILRTQAAGIETRVLPELLVRRRRHRSNMSRSGALEARNEFLDLIGDKIRRDRRDAANGDR
jgi:glycosyltransferase involved in cell wall biosynthesis